MSYSSDPGQQCRVPGETIDEVLRSSAKLINDGECLTDVIGNYPACLLDKKEIPSRYQLIADFVHADALQATAILFITQSSLFPSPASKTLIAPQFLAKAIKSVGEKRRIARLIRESPEAHKLISSSINLADEYLHVLHCRSNRFFEALKNLLNLEQGKAVQLRFIYRRRMNEVLRNKALYNLTINNEHITGRDFVWLLWNVVRDAPLALRHTARCLTGNSGPLTPRRPCLLRLVSSEPKAPERPHPTSA